VVKKWDTEHNTVLLMHKEMKQLSLQNACQEFPKLFSRYLMAALIVQNCMNEKMLYQEISQSYLTRRHYVRKLFSSFEMNMDCKF